MRTAAQTTEGGARTAEPTKLGKKGAQSCALRSTTHARARALESDGDFDLNPDTLSESDEEEEEEEFEILRPEKRKNWDRTVKEERVSITAPMVEVMGINSIELVYRPWNLNDGPTAESRRRRGPFRHRTDDILPRFQPDAK